MDIAGIKKAKTEFRKQGIMVNEPDLYALAPCNDPFHMGQPFLIKASKWVKKWWDRFGYTGGVHLRRIHYRLISQDSPVYLPNGKEYINNRRSWDYLSLGTKAARWLGYIDPALIVDRKNPLPIINTIEEETPHALISSDIDEYSFELPDFPEPPEYFVYGYDQPIHYYHLEIWSEKTTMNDILEPLCRSENINLITGAGELSITAVDRVIKRIGQHQKPCRIFYISDLDHAGTSMPVSISRKIEFYAQNTSLDIQLIPLVLTEEQCWKYNLPIIPLKKDKKLGKARADLFEKRFNREGGTELDALEALYPGELSKIILEAVEKYRDPDIRERISETECEIQDYLDEIQSDIHAKYTDKVEKLRIEYNILKAGFARNIKDIMERIENTHHDIQNEMAGQLTEISIPEVDLVDVCDERENTLYDSKRDYFDQLRKYKEFQKKEINF